MSESVAKFKTVFLDRKAPKDEKSKELVLWSKKFAKQGLAPASGEYSAGNLSFRSEHGMIITASGIDLKKISETDLAEVVECDADDFELKAVGLTEPSSESFIHWEIYKRRPAVNAVFHGHSGLILLHAKELELCITKHFQEYGTIELLKEILNVLGNRNFIVIKQHGFLSLGQTVQEAGDRAIKKLLEAKELEGRSKQNI